MANKQTVMSIVGLVLFWLGAVIIGALKTINGEVFVYPFTLHILK